MSKFINRNFSIIIYFFYLFLQIYVLYIARSYGLLPMPPEETDQLSMLKAAAGICKGRLPGAGYMYSPAYTLFLALLCWIASGDLIIMRILQGMICALIPVFIYKLARIMLFGRTIAQLSAFIYCFYGPALLISLDFLRAAPLALCFLLFTYFTYKAFLKRKYSYYFISGIFAGLCLLGRENFFAVIFPTLFLMLLLKSVRKKTNIKLITSLIAGIILCSSPVLLYNFFKYESLSIIPGNFKNVLKFYHGECITTDKITAFKSILSNIPVQLFNFLSSYEIPNSLSFYAHRDIIDFLKIFVVPFNAIMGFSIVALFSKRNDKNIIFLWLLVGTYAISMLPFHIFYRFRIPAVPLFCILASIGLYQIYIFFRKRMWYYIFFTSVFLLIFLLLTYRNPNKLRTFSERRAVAIALIENGLFQRAERYLAKMKSDGLDTAELEEFLLRKEIESMLPKSP